MKHIAILFYISILSCLSSCTGCSYNHEKAMGSIDNILGKVDTLMKKTDRFLEEHLAGRTAYRLRKKRG